MDKAGARQLLAVLTTRVVDTRGDLRARLGCLTAPDHPEVPVVHANARLTPAGRLLLCQRIGAGRPVAHVAAEMGVSRTCAYRWWTRYRQAGAAGLADRPSTAHAHPRRVPAAVEAEIARLRRTRKLGPARIAPLVGRAASTVHRVLVRLGLNRLAWLDRPSGRLVRRYERAHPGELVHLDVKKLGRLRPGGGHRVHGRDSAQQRAADRERHRGGRRVGYDYVHAAVDDHSRLAYAEVLGDERGPTCAGFLLRAAAFFAAHGVVVQRVLTDNAAAYRRSGAFRTAVQAVGGRQRFTRAYRPQTNGKVERFNRTLLAEWAYARVYADNDQRTAALDTRLHLYNHHRAHTALGGHTPISRVNNAPGSYT
jgi:transposase InsO family protein